MRAYVVRRLAIGVVTIWLTSLVTFLLIHNIPGDPISVVLQQYSSPELRASLEEFYGLNDPLSVQYWRWIGNVLTGDFGTSVISGTSVGGRILQRLPRSLSLMGGALVVSLTISMVAGVLAAVRKGRPMDLSITAGALALQSTPSFWVGILLILFFGVELGWFPTAGYEPLTEGVGPWIRHLALPAIAAGGVLAGITTRTVRASVVGQLGEDYVQLGRASGAGWWTRVLPVHVMRNALIPVVTLVGIQVGALLSGTVIIEQVFSYPGLGQMFIEAVVRRDYPLIQGCILVFAATFVVVNVVVDLVVVRLDPRARLTRDSTETIAAVGGV